MIGTILRGAEAVTATAMLLVLGACGPLPATHLPVVPTETVVDAETVLAAAGPVQSDDFNTCTLSPFWTVVDPRGTSTVSVTGIGTSNARCEIAVPAGPNHDAWSDGNTGVRIMQASPNGDMRLQAKFESALTAGYQTQGFLIEQDLATFLRFDMFFDGGSAYLYSATIAGTTVNERGLLKINNVSPIWLEVVRAGNSWTLNYSTNGTNWITFVSYSWTVTVANTGLWVGNFAVSGNAPAFTARIDYFLNTAAPFAADDPPLTGATLTTSVIGNGTIGVNPSKSAYYCGETVTLTATPAAGWSFSSWSGDVSGTNLQATLAMTQSRSVTATFTTTPPPLQITNVVVTPGITSATVTWSTNVSASSQVRYGTTASYELGTLSDPALVTSHSITLPNLTPATTYHYSITSTASGGATQTTPDATFTTTGSSGLTSDDFNTCTLRPFWMVVDPRGGATVSVSGVGSGNAVLNIAVPAGVSHDVWTDGVNGVRVMQAAPNADFGLQAKFDAPLTTGYQMNGFLVEQDATTLLRYDVFFDGSAVYLYSATLAGPSVSERGILRINNVAPLWLEVVRAGNSWTLRYSTNGNNWSTFLTYSWTANVSKVGVWAGNFTTGSTAPAFTCKVDYFQVAANPITAEDGPLAGATLTTSVAGSGSIDVSPAGPTYYCGETITLTAVPANGWTFSFWSGDLAGSNPQRTLVMTQSRSVNATFSATPQPVQISNVVVTPTSTSATVTWTTNVPASSQVRYGTTTNYELGTQSDAALVTSHSITLPNLTANSTYHYSITSVAADSSSQTTPDAIFATLGAGAFFSDDFNKFNINPAIWTITDPRGDATFSLTGTNTSNAQLRISVPAGVEHDISPAGDLGGPRIMQPAANTDFVLQVRYESAIAQSYQTQGVLIQQDVDTFIRSDFYSESSRAYHYVAILNNGAETTVRNAVIPTSANYYMRITRAGNNWTIAYSSNGTTWTTGATFQYAMTVSSVGVWAGNAGSNAPAHTAIVDYFFNNAQPISPEDGATNVVDTLPPNLIGPGTISSSGAVTVSWSTDEPATATVDYGQTTSYELGSVAGNGQLQRDAVAITGLQPGATYHFRINVSDAAGNTRQSADLVATASVVGPAVNVWYGLTQEFGRIGMPTPFDNILGNVSDPNGVTSLTYTLNGGSSRALSMGPDTRRLAQTGDFNIDLPVSNLQPGANLVRISATNGLGQTSVTDVTVINSHGPVWPLPYTLNWNNVSSISSDAHVVDGLWALSGGTVRPTVLAYDRLIGIGDISWTDYEVLVPITPYSFDPAGYAAPSYGPGIGVLVRWPGHTNDGHQPWEGVYPLGCLAMYRWQTTTNEWQLFGNNGVLLQTVVEPLQLGITYMYRLRVQTGANASRATYSFKVWPAGTTEPTAWKMTGTQTNDPGYGCLLLLAHHVDAAFGPVTITPGPFGN